MGLKPIVVKSGTPGIDGTVSYCKGDIITAILFWITEGIILFMGIFIIVKMWW